MRNLLSVKRLGWPFGLFQKTICTRHQVSILSYSLCENIYMSSHSVSDNLPLIQSQYIYLHIQWYGNHLNGFILK